MRNKLLPVLLLLLCFSRLVLAQTNGFERRFRFGLVGGSQIFGKTFTYENLETVKGTVLGIDASYHFSSKNRSGFSLHIQPNWNRYKRKNEYGGNLYNYDIQAFNVPSFVRYAFTSGKIRPFLEAGLNVRTRTFFEITQTGTICQIYDGPCFYGENTIDLHPQTSQDRFGVLAGVGVELDVWRITIPVTIRINEGLGTYKMKKMMADSYYYDELKTSNIQITAGITF